MVAKTRQLRRERTAKHIPSPKAWDREANKWIINPEIAARKDEVSNDKLS